MAPDGTGEVSVHVVEREPERLPFVAPLLQRWMELAFAPGPCREALERLMAEPRSGASEALLDARAVTEGGVVARPALLYPAASWSLRFLGGEPPWRAGVAFDEDAAPAVAALLRGGLSEAARTEWLPAAVRRRLAARPTTSQFPGPDQPGLYRREHGCAVIRSRTTTIVLDPVAYWMPHAPRAPLDGVDAIFITHGHADHFSLPSILALAPDPTTPVVVPPVPRPSLLAPNDMAAALRLFGQRALAPAWGTSVRIGDIEVDVLPFYGEQPVREGPGGVAGLRNWGSCYRFNTPDFSALALIDSGVDPEGSMVAVAEDSARRRGPVDFVLSSLPRFGSPFFFGLPHYYLALPFARLGELHRQHLASTLPSVTPGPEGIAEVCAAARARHYLPYGNGFEGLGRPIRDVGMNIGEPSEAEALGRLRGFLAERTSATVAVDWNPGDHVTPRGVRAAS
jgi:L-ascorbate metabolism protein UlaG (beta-lactamase superfamily)